ncbi:DMT family transporter [Noviherbaspirillum malthae]|jgi:drug/metabolite transporter (DMT)-like permease|uniref:DMT family transporter n=1 Tax=Noviherbaspirillum malthae TaxID=1260987 RepID=UPI001890527C|nr:DMT family transporter [Noviherbaspirillum malthae]
MSRNTAIALVLLSALGFGSMALFARTAYDAGVSPSMLLTLRFAIAVALLAPLVRLRRAALPRGRTLAGFVLMGLLYTGQSQAYFTALIHASSGLVGLLLYTYPVLVTMLAVAIGSEKLDRRTMALLAVAVTGMAVMLGGDLQGTPLGIILGLAAAAIYAVYILLGGRITKGIDPLAGTLVIMSVACLGNGGFALADGSALPPTPAAWMAIAAIAALTAVAVTTFLVGIRHVGPSQASIISTLEPVITLCLGVALLSESVSAGQLLGGAMVLCAVILLAMRTRAGDEAPRARTAAAEA